ncbi:MAG TPA: sialidase family protein [Candidatus Thermoplasmatota archaeon]|nr:sialidase family protein [Candidatus Thermoplasmatota archaeon]
MRFAAILSFLLLAGCASTAPPAGERAPFDAATWSDPAVIDPVRSGGEPVLFTTPTGTLLIAAHPGFTHIKPPPGLEVVQPANAQSYLYRSDDDGATWSAVTGPMNAPRNQAPGDSDPDLAASDDGSLVVMAQLDGIGISSEASSDDGVTWPGSNALVAKPSDGSVDRPWLAQLGGTFLLLYNGDNAGHWRMLSSTDGVSWGDHSAPGDGSYPGAMVVDKARNAVYVGNGDKVWSSTDAGKTFAAAPMPTTSALTGITAQRPAVDDDGTVYFAWSELHGISYAYSHDQGATWQGPVPLVANGTHIWPWPVAGQAGRLAVVWLGTQDEAGDDPATYDSEWNVYAAFLDAADTAAPRMSVAPIPNAIAMHGGICLDGTICEAEGKDRRLGDFITASIGRTGDLHVAYGTTETGHSVSSPAYVRQTGGFRLR